MFEALQAQRKQKRETEDVKRKDEYHQFRQDWWYCEQRDESTRVEWAFKIPWTNAMERVAKQLGAENRGMTAYPMGRRAYPFGPAVKYDDNI